MKRDFTGFSFCSRLAMECTAMQIPFFFFSAAWRAVSPYSGRNWHTPDKCPGCPLPTSESACSWDNAYHLATSPVRRWKPVCQEAGCQPRTCGTWRKTSVNPPVKSHPPAALSLSVQELGAVCYLPLLSISLLFLSLLLKLLHKVLHNDFNNDNNKEEE